MNSRTMRMFGLALASTYFLYAASTPDTWHFIDYVNLIFHEAGHTIFFFLGEFIQVAMGSGLQILLPLFISLHFFYTRQRYSTGIVLMWTGQSLINVSVYARDAVAMQLPLLGGDSVIHDWNYMLDSLHLLHWTPFIASTISTLGFLSILAGIALSYFYIDETTVLN